MAEVDSFKIRDVMESDIPAIHQMAKLIFCDDAWLIDEFYELFYDEDMYLLCAVDQNNNIVGHIVLDILRGTITDIAVVAEKRNMGIGKSLLHAIIQESMRRKFNSINLHVRMNNTIAQRLYKKMGFEEVDIYPNYYNYPIEDAIIMELQFN